jgi:MYXO-CTERM domain-containing protein
VAKGRAHLLVPVAILIAIGAPSLTAGTARAQGPDPELFRAEDDLRGAGLMAQMGRFDDAVPLAESAVARFAALHKPRGEAETLAFLASVRAAEEDYPGAKDALARGFAATEKPPSIEDEDDPEETRAMLRGTRAAILYAEGDGKAALADIDAVDAWNTGRGRVGGTSVLRALVCLELHEVAGAVRAIDGARAALRSDAGRDERISVRQAAAFVDLAAGKSSEAVTELRAVNDDLEMSLSDLGGYATEEMLLSFAALVDDATETVVSAHMQFAPGDPAAARLAMTVLLQRKGRVMDAVALRRRLLHEHASGDAAGMEGELAAMRAQAASVTVGRRALPPDQAKKLADLEAAIEEKEQRLFEAVFRQTRREGSATEVTDLPWMKELSPPAPTLDAVRATLPEGGALMELARYRPIDPQGANEAARHGSPRFAVYVLAATGDLRWADLGEASPIDASIAALRRALADPRRDVREPARALDAAVMQPARGLLGGARTLYLAPSGTLNLVPFEALVDEAGHYLVERYAVRYVASGRDLAVAAPSARSGPPLVLAAPDFDHPPLGSAPTVPAAATVGDLHVRFPELPGTLAEARGLSTLLPGAAVLTGTAASRGALEQAHGPSILHVATHGFFLGADAGAAATGSRGLVLDVGGGAGGIPPRGDLLLARAGIALAGANVTGSAPGGGVMTALEVASLDLHGTKLAVLSACETGVGDTSNADGVFGLRRALVLAGAETQVLSLWKVDDEATAQLMLGYYARLRRGEGRSDALRDEKLAMLSSPRFAHPFYWASFIASGDATTLDGKPSVPRFAPLARPRGVVAPTGRGCACGVASSSPRGSAAPLLALLGAGILFAARRQRDASTGRKMSFVPTGP